MKPNPRLFFLAITTCLASAHMPPLLAQSFLTNGLVAYYPFSGNANDESGKGNNGNAIGATFTGDRFGEEGKAMAFNGIDQYVQAAHQDYLNFSGGDFTVSCWVSLNDPAKTQYIVGKDMGQGNTDKWIVHYGSEVGGTTPWGLSFLIGTAPNEAGFYAPSLGRPDVGTWHRYLVRKNGTNYTIYFDIYGVSGGNGPLTLPNGNTAPLTIGQSESGGFVDGKIDEIRIYSRALSPDEIGSLYRYESQSQVTLVKAIKPSFSRLIIGRNYILQVSSDLVIWTNQGKMFTATDTSMVYPQYWDVDNWSQLYFRLWLLPL